MSDRISDLNALYDFQQKVGACLVKSNKFICLFIVFNGGYSRLKQTSEGLYPLISINAWYLVLLVLLEEDDEHYMRLQALSANLAHFRREVSLSTYMAEE